jgi:hypothetical protein
MSWGRWAERISGWEVLGTKTAERRGGWWGEIGSWAFDGCWVRELQVASRYRVMLFRPMSSWEHSGAYGLESSFAGTIRASPLSLDFILRLLFFGRLLDGRDAWAERWFPVGERRLSSN